MKSLPKIREINKQGVQKLSRDIMTLQQNLALFTGYAEPMFEKVRNYYHLLGNENTAVSLMPPIVLISTGNPRFVGETSQKQDKSRLQPGGVERVDDIRFPRPRIIRRRPRLRYFQILRSEAQRLPVSLQNMCWRLDQHRAYFATRVFGDGQIPLDINEPYHIIPSSRHNYNYNTDLSAHAWVFSSNHNCDYDNHNSVFSLQTVTNA